MKAFKIIIGLLFISLSVMSQRKYQKIVTPYEFQHVRATKGMVPPRDTLTVADSGAVASKGNKLYLKYNGVYIQVGGSSSSGVDSIKRKVGSDSVFFYFAGVKTFAFKDSIGAVGSGVDSIRKKSGSDSVFFYYGGVKTFAFRDSSLVISITGNSPVYSNSGGNGLTTYGAIIHRAAKYFGTLPGSWTGGGTNVITSTTNGALSVDGVAVSVGDRVLHYSATYGDGRLFDVGLWIVTQTGSAGTPWILTRDALAQNANAFQVGTIFYVTNGNFYSKTWWTVTTAPTTLGSSFMFMFQAGQPDDGLYGTSNGGGSPVAVQSTLGQGKIHYVGGLSFDENGRNFFSGGTAVLNGVSPSTYSAAIGKNVRLKGKYGHLTTGQGNDTSRIDLVFQVGNGAPLGNTFSDAFWIDSMANAYLKARNTGDREGTPLMGNFGFNADSAGRFEAYNGSSWDTYKPVKAGSATLNFASTAAGTSTDLSVSVPGCVDGDPVTLGVPNASTLSNGSFSAWVSASDVVTVRFTNNSSGALDPASGTFKIVVIKY